MLRSYSKIFILILSTGLIFSCSKDDGNTDPTDSSNHAPVSDFTYTDDVDRYTLTSTAYDDDDDELVYLWKSTPQIVLYSSHDQSTYFNLPSSDVTTNVTVKLIVDDGNTSDTAVKNITLPALTKLRQWGLGRTLEKEVSNNVNYEWYIDQMNTGTYSYNNCGPSSVTMAIKWYNAAFTGTAEDARHTYVTGGGWWYTSDIINYLNKFSVNNYTISLANTGLLTTEIDKGNIIILCLDMYYITKTDNAEWHVDKFYNTSSTGWGHFIVIKGYKKVDGAIEFEAYDPYSFGVAYADNSLKGKDRYYRSEDIDDATNYWWDYAIVVSHSKEKNLTGVDTGKIPHKYGL